MSPEGAGASRITRRTLATYVAVGAANVGFSYLVYRLLLLVTDLAIAYSVSYVAGLLLGYVLNSVLTFRREMRVATLLRYPLAYVPPYVVGLVLVTWLVRLGLDPRIAPFAILPVTVPLGFVLTRMALHAGRPGSSASGRQPGG